MGFALDISHRVRLLPVWLPFGLMYKQTEDLNWLVNEIQSYIV